MARTSAAPARTVAWAGAGLIRNPADVGRLLDHATQSAGTREQTAGLRRPVRRLSVMAGDEPDAAEALPLAPELHELTPWPGGLRRGVTISVLGSTSLLFAVLADAMAAGAWGALVGLPQASAIPAAAEYGLDLGRLAWVPDAGDDWPRVVGSLVDGVDLVVVSTAAPVPARTASALTARARRTGAVLLPVQDWPGSQLSIKAGGRRWYGLGQGRGRIREQKLVVTASGRGRAEQPRRVTTAMPPESIARRVGPLPGTIPGLPSVRPGGSQGGAAIRPIGVRAS